MTHPRDAQEHLLYMLYMARSCAWPLALATLLSCGPGDVEPIEDWMYGSFSSHSAVPACIQGDQIERYVVHEDGRFEIISVSASSGEWPRWQARWERRDPGRIRVVRDEAHLEPDPYPIRAGTEWEIVHSSECTTGAEDIDILWYDIDEIDLDTGTRHDVGSMTPGALCIESDGGCGEWPMSHVYWCEGATPPAPDCG